MKDGVARLVAAAGLANDWDALKTDELKPLLPAGSDLSKKSGDPGATTLAWSDLNGNGRIDRDEVQFRKGWKWGGVTVLPDLSFVLPESSRLTPMEITESGVPRYDLGQAVPRFDWKVAPTSGGGQILSFPDDLSVATAGPIQGFRPAAAEGVETTPLWTYPNQWPGLHASHLAPVATTSTIRESPRLGLHASHLAPVATSPGEILGATRLLALPMSFDSADPNDKAPLNLWGINGNMGSEYLMTSDGLFVATLFKDHRQGKAWPDQAVRGMPLNDVSLSGESFYNTISQTADGAVYVQNSNHIIRVDGLETMRRLPAQTIEVTPELLAAAQDYFVARDAARLTAAFWSATVSKPSSAFIGTTKERR